MEALHFPLSPFAIILTPVSLRTRHYALVSLKAWRAWFRLDCEIGRGRVAPIVNTTGAIGCQIGCQGGKNKEAVPGKSAVYRFLMWWAGRGSNPRPSV